MATLKTKHKGADVNKNLQHFVFTTKYRKQLFQPEERASHLLALFEHICTLKNIEIKKIAIQPEHVHVLVMMPRTMTVAYAAYIMKWFTSIWMRKRYPDLKRYKALWGVHYYSDSIGADKKTVSKYISDQQ